MDIIVIDVPSCEDAEYYSYLVRHSFRVEDTDFEDKFMFVVHDPMLIDEFLCDTSYVEELKKLNYHLDNKVYTL